MTKPRPKRPVAKQRSTVPKSATGRRASTRKTAPRPAAKRRPRARGSAQRDGRQTIGASSVQTPGEPAALGPAQLAALRAQLDARIAEAMPARWNPDPEEVRRAVMKLVLTIVEFVRQLLERQAVRRMEAQSLTAEQVEAVGLALMRLEEAVRDLAKQSGLEYSELNLDLGPLGRLI
jgi:hypothetical protein